MRRIPVESARIRPLDENGEGTGEWTELNVDSVEIEEQASPTGEDALAWCVDQLRENGQLPTASDRQIEIFTSLMQRRDAFMGLEPIGSTPLSHWAVGRILLNNYRLTGDPLRQNVGIAWLGSALPPRLRVDAL